MSSNKTTIRNKEQGSYYFIMWIICHKLIAALTREFNVLQKDDDTNKEQGSYYFAMWIKCHKLIAALLFIPCSRLVGGDPSECFLGFWSSVYIGLLMPMLSNHLWSLQVCHHSYTILIVISQLLCSSTFSNRSLSYSFPHSIETNYNKIVWWCGRSVCNEWRLLLTLEHGDCIL